MNIKMDTLSQIARRGGNLAATCRCRHRGVLDIDRLSRWFSAHGWNEHLEVVGYHLYCSRCWRRDRKRQRPEYLRPTPEPPTNALWGPQSEDEWKRLVKRLRG